MVSFLMAKIRWQDKTNFYFRRHPPNSIYPLLEPNLRLLITVGFGISKANSSRNSELASIHYINSNDTMLHAQGRQSLAKTTFASCLPFPFTSLAFPVAYAGTQRL